MHAQPIEFLKLLNGDVQYVIPLWQRRYCWGKADIERLIDDLLAIADAPPLSTHYAGNLLTYRKPGVPGVTDIIHVVDGQQRLATVSILLACIAAKLECDGPCGEWTPEIVWRRLANPLMDSEKRYKLRLQDGDEEEYRRGLVGEPRGAGPVTQAWRIADRLVRKSDTARLLGGLSRLRVVSIGLDVADDPQQIFESLNATGRPLAESEKVKNWLLIGLPEKEQRELHRVHWRKIERELGAEHGIGLIDVFLRDVMRRCTGEVRGGKNTYEQFRRWALKEGRAKDRPALCRDLARLAPLYGSMTGTAEEHPHRRVARELRHLRELGWDVHRPLTLRLLDDASKERGASNEELAKTVAGIGAWFTRLLLADLGSSGLNKVMAELACGEGPGAGENYAEHWLDRIRKLRDQRVGVPTDEDVRKGVRTRKAYGGAATRATFAVLCELMETEHPGEAPDRSDLTVEHVMPRKLTEAWKDYLGEDAEEVHGRHRDRLANLTLSGDVVNSRMGQNAFSRKREDYRRSTVGMTRRVADESEWNEEALSRRSEDLARRALARWPWSDREASANESRNEIDVVRDFWESLKTAGGVPGQRETWRGDIQWTDSLNASGDLVNIYVGSDVIQLYVRSELGREAESVARMRRFSRSMRGQMADQVLEGDPEKRCGEGKTVYVKRSWTRDDEDEWDEACQWIRDQCERLRLVMESSEEGEGRSGDE